MMDIEELRELIGKLGNESNNLANKIFKLENVLYSTGSEQFTKKQIDLLDIQLFSMKTYYSTLRTRMEDLKDEIIRLENR